MDANTVLGLVKRSILLLTLIVLNAQLPGALAQGTVFTFQGQLQEGDTPYTGSAEFRATLWDAAEEGSQIAVNDPAEVVVEVVAGLFALPLDFGGSFSGGERWLQLEVRTDIGLYTPLSPRNRITATPYAMTAGNLTGTVSAQQLSGTLRSANVSGDYDNPVTFSHADNSFSGNAKGLTGLNASELTSGTVPDARLPNTMARTSQVWGLSGNTGTKPPLDFLGTTDDRPLEIRVNGLRALRLEDNGDSSDNDTTPDGAPNLIGGSRFNRVGEGVVGATIGGGGAANHSGFTFTNSVLSNYGVVGGGLGNSIADSSSQSTISGGRMNRIGAAAGSSFIGGGIENLIADGAEYSTIAGGRLNEAGGNATYGSIGGGLQNIIEEDSEQATIAGGRLNRIRSGANYSVVGGGSGNAISDNTAWATIPGGSQNSASGHYSFAAGRQAKASHQGAFVWADSQEASFASSANDQFLISASGGVGIGTADPVSQLTVAGAGAFNSTRAAAVVLDNTTADRRWQWHVLDSGNVQWADYTAGLTRMMITTSGNVGIGTVNPTQRLHVSGNILASGTVTGSSDRNVKENFAAVDPKQVLEKVASMPIQRWNYIGEETPHLGPVAQDFYGAFQVGMDDKHISMVDADGVALAAIQGLNQKLKEKEARIAELEARLVRLEQHILQSEAP